MRKLCELLILSLLLFSCKQRQSESITKNSVNIVTQDETLDSWILFLKDPASYFPDVIDLSDDIKIPKSAIKHYTVESREDRYRYSQITTQQSFVLLNNGETFSMYCDGQNALTEQLQAQRWDGELIHRMKAYMAPKFFQVRRFRPEDYGSVRTLSIKSNWTTNTNRGSTFVYRVFANQTKVEYAIQLIGRLEARDHNDPDIFYSVSDPYADGFLEDLLAKKLQIEVKDVQKMFDAKLLSKLPKDKKAYTVGKNYQTDKIYWKPER